MSSTPRLKVMTLLDQLIASGGAERMAMELAMRLDRDRFESVVCASRYAPGMRWESIQKAEERLEAAGVRYIGLGRSGRFDMRCWEPLYRELRSGPYDVLHSHMFGSNLWGTIVGRVARVPVLVSHEHTWSFEGEPLRRLLDRNVIARGSSVFVAVSEQDRRRMMEIERIPAARILFVPNGIATPPPPTGADVRAELGIAPDAPVIGTVSVLRAQKALHLLVQATATLVAERPDLRVLIAGEGPEYLNLEEQARRLGVADNVILTGFRADVPDVLAALDVAVSCSSFEGSPLAVMEMMEAARPIVATEVGGVPDLIDDGVHGLLVASGDAGALATALARMLDDPEAARAMGERARQRRREDFDIDVAVGRFEALYEHLRAGGTVPASVQALAS